MKRAIASVVILFFVSQVISAQGFIKLYENLSNRYFTEALGTPDNGYVFFTREGLNKTDAAGNILWTTPLDRTLANNGIMQPILLDNGDYLLVTQALPGGGPSYDFAAARYTKGGDTSSINVVRVTAPQYLSDFEITQSGDYLWAGRSLSPDRGVLFWTDDNLDTIQTYTNWDWRLIEQVEELPNGELIVFWDGNGSYSRGLARFSAQGNLIWEKNLGHMFERYSHSYKPGLLITSDTNIAIMGYAEEYTQQYYLEKMILAKFTLNGDSIWAKDIVVDSNYLETRLVDFIETEDDGFIFSGNHDYIELDSSGNPIRYAQGGIAIKTDENGNVIWERDYFGGFHTNTYFLGISKAPNGGYLIYGDYEYNAIWGGNNNVPMVVKLSEGGTDITSFIEGSIFKDLDNDCYPFLEDGLQNWVVTAQNANNSVQFNNYSITDADGHFSIKVDTGTYALNIESPFPYWQTNNCAPSSYTVQVNSFHDTSIYDFPVYSAIDCPLMTVDLSTPFLRRCFPNTYNIRYCNTGTLPADSAYVTLDIDYALVVDSASIPFTVDAVTGLYRFDLGTIQPGYCGSFKLHVTVDCNLADNGQTHCIEAHIYPDTICLPQDPVWDGSDIVVDATCDGQDSVTLSISNQGDNMAEGTAYL